MARQRKTHTAEYKLAAVKMIAEKLSVAEASRRLGVAEGRRHERKKAHATKGPTPSPAAATSRHSKRTANSGPRLSGWRWSATS